MKQAALLLAAYFCILSVPAQQQLHIHHINIENGDATLIGIYDVALQKYMSKILIDGGQLQPEARLLPYIKKMVGIDQESTHFQYVILTHYHNDHYNGLLAIQDGRITADSIIDPGGYPVRTYFNQAGPRVTRPDSLKIAATWLTAIKTAARHTPRPYVKGRSLALLRFGSNPSTDIGNAITIGMVGANPVELRCIAGWGNTLSANDEIEPNPKPKKPNANNFTLAFILSCGEFRYFIGGDMGGETAGQYIDQESAVTTFLNDAYPHSRSVTGTQDIPGHLCGFKSNHHGSDHSNEEEFIEGMHPAITITSAGNNSNWHLPHPKYLERLAQVTALSTSNDVADSTFNRGVYFTNLYDFTGYPSKTKANTLFRNKPGISYNYGNNTSTAKASYVIKITDEDAITRQSVFEVGRVDITKPVPYQRLAFFSCHRQ